MRADMTRLEWCKWKVSGEVARIIIEEFESPADALGIPMLGVVLAATFAVFTAASYVGGNPASIIFTAFLGLLAVALGIQAVLMTLAAIVYYREPTSRFVSASEEGGV